MTLCWDLCDMASLSSLSTWCCFDKRALFCCKYFQFLCHSFISFPRFSSTSSCTPIVVIGVCVVEFGFQNDYASANLGGAHALPMLSFGGAPYLPARYTLTVSHSSRINRYVLSKFWFSLEVLLTVQTPVVDIHKPRIVRFIRGSFINSVTRDKLVFTT